jgi:hypothetical protein
MPDEQVGGAQVHVGFDADASRSESFEERDAAEVVIV